MLEVLNSFIKTPFVVKSRACIVLDGSAHTSEPYVALTFIVKHSVVVVLFLLLTFMVLTCYCQFCVLHRIVRRR